MKSAQQKMSLDRFIYESMGEKQYLISCLDDELFKKALKGFRKEQHSAKKMPEQNNRPGIEHYSLVKNNSAAAPITAKETEPSKLTTKSALTDNSLNTIRSRNSRTVSHAFTTNLLITQGFLPHLPVRVESRVFLPFRNLEGLISKGASASLSESILHRKTKALNPTRFSFSKEERSCA